MERNISSHEGKHNLVARALDGYCLLNPNTHLIKGSQVVVLDKPRKGVNIVCGGRAGYDAQHVL